MNANGAPLDGVLIADFSRVLAGPYATMLLGDLGATVIKVERPDTGDDTRSWGPPFDAEGTATYFSGLNRNKLSIALDFNDPDDLAIAQDIAGKADVLIENHRANSLTPYGLDFDSLTSANRGLIYCSISGFGSQAGADWPGYDLLVQAMGGLMSVTGTSEPTKVGVAVVDVIAGLHAAVAVLAALRQREQTGRGELIEINLLSSLLSGLVNQASAFVQVGQVPGLMGNAHPSIAPYEVYQASDQPMVIAVGNDYQFASLANAIGRPDLATDVRFAKNSDRVTNRGALNDVLGAIFFTRSAADWGRLLSETKVPCGPINDLSQAFALAESLGLQPIHESADSLGVNHREVANPIRFSSSKITYRSSAPGLDADRERVLRLLGDREY